MTAARPSRKPHVRSFWLSSALIALALGGIPAALHAATTERVVVDRQTGLAIYGIDPVAYFTDRKPVNGRVDFEYRHAGAIWRFHNEGNRAAFARDPDVYMPRFGGYDPVGVSKGLSTAGYPQLWVVYDERLYLFYTENARQAFVANPMAVIAAAAARWADVKGDLAE
jgi:YHS domain-containing protein